MQKKGKKQRLNTRNPPEEVLAGLLKSYQSGQLDIAEKLAVSLIREFPENQFSWKILGAILKQTGRIDDSLTAMQKSVQLSPLDPHAHSNLGATLLEIGRLDEAEASCLKAIKLKPNFAAAHNNLGVTLKGLGRLEEAERSCSQAIALDPSFTDTYNTLGTILYELGRLSEAEVCYKQAIALKPEYVEAYSNLGAALHGLGRLSEAEASYKTAISLRSDFSEAHTNLGATLLEFGRLSEAETCFRRAIAAQPNYLAAYLNLCELLEKSNRGDELLSFIRSELVSTFRNKSDILYYEALVEFRKEKYQTASAIMRKIKIEEIEKKRKPAVMKLIGDICDCEKSYDTAFKAYTAKNQYIKESLEYRKQEPDRFLAQQKEKVSQLEYLREKFTYEPRVTPKWIQPVFLIGFPRSGTTLLDTILRTHSNIDVLEELSMVDRVSASLGDMQSVSRIEAMDVKDIEIASGFYFKELGKHMRLGEKRVLVDKLPLNILQLPLISQIFPNAKYIVSLRHPLDCVLSNWIQDFKLNPAMSNMVDLDRVVEFYDIAMCILKLSEERYLLNTYRIRYEDLVSDFVGNISGLLGFLDLDWEEELKSYQKTALARSRINTPSSSQVIKPLYQTSAYRWTNYEAYLGQYRLRLARWIQEYGYHS